MSRIGELTGELFKIKKRKAALKEQHAELHKQQQNLEKDLIEVLKEQGLNKISTDYGAVYLREKTVPKVVEWEAFNDYVTQNNYLHLFQRRVSVASWKDLHDQGIEVPGVETVVFDEVATRKS